MYTKMNHKGILSSAFNMSLGYLPVIISIILCEFITQDTAIYIGTGIGMLYSYYSMHRKGVRIPNFILYISTFMLMLLTLAALIPGDYVPPGALPLTLEVSILTIGQYLQPTRRHYPVEEYVTPEQFAQYKQTGLEKGFEQVESAPLVRSSYHAEKHIKK